MKIVQPLLHFFAGDSGLLSLCMLVWNKFSLRSWTFIVLHSQFLKILYSEGKITSLITKHKQVV